MRDLATTCRYPDFIIGGAPKCGTTSLHFMLAANPAIGMPDEEIHYFDADDPITHPDFFFRKDGRLAWFDCRPENEAARAWYARRFEPFADRPLIGEDSTTYLFSEVAAARIARMLPDTRMIFMLRDPVARAYSQYWHLMKTARVSCAFEDAIIAHSSIVLGSTYAPHLRRWLDLFGRDKVRVILFEELAATPQATADEVAIWLGALPSPAPPEAAWSNRTAYPRAEAVQRRLNRVGRLLVRQRYRNHMGGGTGLSERARRKLHYWWFERINPLFLTEGRPPPMREDTAAYLAQHLAARNEGLSELLGRDLATIWPSFHA